MDSGNIGALIFVKRFIDMVFRRRKSIDMRYANKRNVPVYTNTPIGSDEVDYLGLDPYAKHIYDALDKSNTIGIIGDFGTGKSSLIEYLKNKYLNGKFNVAAINLWSINESSIDDSIDIHIHFLYQLSVCLTSQRFSKTVNRRVNRNYGLFAFDVNIFSGVLLLIACVLYLFYGFLKPEDLSWIECILEVTKAGIVLCLTIICLIIGVFKANITISSGKNENKREVNSNEIIEIYKDILKHRRWKNKKLVIVIEDLDRSSDWAQAYNFLQELNRYYINSLDEEEQEKVKFIVNIRPEKEFAKDKDISIYSKVFDYTINLFPINASNYDVILDDLLNEQKENLERIGINVFTEKNAQKIPGMKRLVYGKELTLRDVKERLNCAILIYNSLLSNLADEERKKNVKFEKCAFVAYLKNTYPIHYLKIYKNIDFENVILDYAIKNKNSEYDLEETLRSALEGTDVEFINDIKSGIKDKLIDTDYKMYFYNYPKNAYIRSLNEAIVYNAIMYDDEYSSDFDISLNEAILLDGNIISNTYEERRSVTNILPRVTFRNGLLFEHCIINYKKDTFDNLKSILNFDNKAITKSKLVLENLFSLKLRNLNWNKLLLEYTEEFRDLFVERLEIVEEKSILAVRSTILDYFADQIEYFDYLFGEGFPAIQSEEIKRIPNINVGLTLSLLQDVDFETIKTIHQVIMNNKIEDETVNLVSDLYDNAADAIKDEKELGVIFATFSERIGILSIKREEYIFDLAENNSDFLGVYIEALNDTNGRGVEGGILVNHIKKLKIKAGLEIPLIERILIGADNQLFISNLLSVNYNITNIITYKEVLKEEILNIYEDGGETAISKLRYEVLKAAKENNDVLKELDFLFKKPMCIITEDELSNVLRMEDALDIIDCEQLDLDNVRYIGEYINHKGVRHPSLVYKVLALIASAENDVAKQLFQLLDFNKVVYKAVSEEKRKAFIESIEETFELVSNKTEIICFLEHINYLEKNLEVRLSGGFNQEESRLYTKLLNEINANDIDDVTIDVLQTSGYYSVHNEAVQTKLYEYKQYGRYVYAKTMHNKRFDFEKDNLEYLSKSYKELLKNSNFTTLHDIMFKNTEFREYAIKEKIYSELDDEMLLYFAKGIQTKEIIECVFTKEDDVIIKYFSEIVSIANYETEQFLLDKLVGNIQILLNDSVYRNVRKCMTDSAIKNKYKNKRAYRKRKKSS